MQNPKDYILIGDGYTWPKMTFSSMAHLMFYALQKDTKEETGYHYIHGIICKINSRFIAIRHHHYWWSGQLQYIDEHCSILNLIQAEYMTKFWLHHYCPPHFTWKPQNKMLNKWGNRQLIVERVSASNQQIYPAIYFFLNSSRRIAVSKWFCGFFPPHLLSKIWRRTENLCLSQVSVTVWPQS